MSKKCLLTMRHIVKSFSGVAALKGINLTIYPAEIVSLCGENGSGKSTLMKVLCGVYPHGDFEGEILFENDPLFARSIRDTEVLGIAMIHQELTLIQELSVLENIFLGDERTVCGMLNHAEMFSLTRALLKRVRLQISPDTKVSQLGVGQQQLVEIAKALRKQARVLILDEPSAPLTDTETALLLNIVRCLRQEGVSCIYISHRLNEVKAISDRICIIRDGEEVKTCEASLLSTEKIINMMVGREMTRLSSREENRERNLTGEVILKVGPVNAWRSANSQIKQVNQIQFDLHRGEVLGISGLVGSGRTELMECLFGCYRGPYQIKVELEGNPIKIRNPRDALKFGIAMVPEDRKRHGIIPIMGVGKNITLANLGSFILPPLRHLNEAAELQSMAESSQTLGVKVADLKQPIRSLSGGNQQKVVLAKYLQLKPRILILDEPTRGIDIGAKYEIYRLIFELVKQGISIIMVSSELPEVLGISDRILVMHEGHLRGDLLNHHLTQEAVMDCALAGEE